MSDKKEKKPIMSQEQIMQLLDSVYEKVTDGIPHVSPPVEEFAQNYYDKKRQDSKAAAKSLINNQVLKCTTSGVVTGFGGLITLPVAVPANVGSVLYVQMRMIAGVAYLGGYDTSSDQVQTLVYACLAGVAVNQVLKKFGIEIAEKTFISLVKKIPGSVLTRINKAVGFRLVTKFGTKGLINIGKLVPGVGAAVSGGFDFVETKVIGARAYKWFIEGDFTMEEDDATIEIIEDMEDIPPKQDAETANI